MVREVEFGLDQVLGSAQHPSQCTPPDTQTCGQWSFPTEGGRGEGLAWLEDEEFVVHSLICDRNSVGGVTKFCTPANNTASKVGPNGSPDGRQASMTLSPRQAHKNSRESSDSLMLQGPRGVGLLCAE